MAVCSRSAFGCFRYDQLVSRLLPLRSLQRLWRIMLTVPFAGGWASLGFQSCGAGRVGIQSWRGNWSSGGKTCGSAG